MQNVNEMKAAAGVAVLTAIWAGLAGLLSCLSFAWRRTTSQGVQRLCSAANGRARRDEGCRK